MSFIVSCIFTEEVEERVFAPHRFQVYDYYGMWRSNDDIDYIDGCWELTEEGKSLVNDYLDDYSCGYDLRDGKMKGLAAQYRYDEFFEKVTGNEFYAKEYNE